jgi:hypothetical protein
VDNHLLPKPQVEIKSRDIKSLMKDMQETLGGRNQRRVILQVRQDDRYELASFFRTLFRRMDLPHHLVETDLAFEERFNDPNPDAIVVTYGDALPHWSQSTIGERYTRASYLTPYLVVLTERDPGDLYRHGTWTPSFRAAAVRTFKWPSVRDRYEGDLVRLVIAFAGKINPDLRVRQGFAEFYVKDRLLTKDGNPEKGIARFETVGQLHRGAEALVKLAKESGVSELTSSFWLDTVRPGWRDSLPDYGKRRGSRPLTDSDAPSA